MPVEKLTGVELDLADHDPASIELQSNSQRAGDEVAQRHVDGPDGLRQRVALVDVADAAGRRAAGGEHRGAGEDAHVSVEQVVGVDAHRAEISHAVEPTQQTKFLETMCIWGFEGCG